MGRTGKNSSGPTEITVGRKIEVILLLRKMTKAALAEKIGMTAQALRMRFRNDRFSNNELEDIAEALGCDLDFCFTDKETGEKMPNIYI